MNRCLCGCGQELKPDTKGRMPRYKKGHHGRFKGSSFRIEDRGFETMCHIWVRHLDRDGYALMWHLGKTRRAFAVFYERAHGPIPDGLVLDHLCRQRDCVNAEHGEPVTNAENVRRGSGTILTADGALQIIDNPSTSGVELATRFGVSQQTICDIRKGRKWANVTSHRQWQGNVPPDPPKGKEGVTNG